MGSARIYVPSVIELGITSDSPTFRGTRSMAAYGYMMNIHHLPRIGNDRWKIKYIE